MWFFINLTGIHMVPTLVVFGGMLPLFEIADGKCGLMSVPGMLLILLGVAFEFFADRQMHEFLSSPKSSSVILKNVGGVTFKGSFPIYIVDV